MQLVMLERTFLLELSHPPIPIFP